MNAYPYRVLTTAAAWMVRTRFLATARLQATVASSAQRRSTSARAIRVTQLDHWIVWTTFRRIHVHASKAGQAMSAIQTSLQIQKFLSLQRPL